MEVQRRATRIYREIEMITVIDVIREWGIEPTRRMTVTVGTVVREQWRDKNNGELPLKALRPKTNGKGSHCIAVYPDEWRTIILDAIANYQHSLS